MEVKERKLKWELRRNGGWAGGGRGVEENFGIIEQQGGKRRRKIEERGQEGKKNRGGLFALRQEAETQD